MESINESMSEPEKNQLMTGYFYCPNCGEMDSEFFDDVLIKRVNKDQYKNLSDEQKLYINKKYEYGVLLCEHCYDKTKRKARLIRGLYLLGFVLIYLIPLVAIAIIPIILYIEKYKLTRNFDFKHVWECGAVRRLHSN